MCANTVSCRLMSCILSSLDSMLRPISTPLYNESGSLVNAVYEIPWDLKFWMKLVDCSSSLSGLCFLSHMPQFSSNWSNLHWTTSSFPFWFYTPLDFGSFSSLYNSVNLTNNASSAPILTKFSTRTLRSLSDSARSLCCFICLIFFPGA